MLALAGLVSPPRYREGDGLALAGEAEAVVEAVASAGAGMHPTTTPGGNG